MHTHSHGGVPDVEGHRMFSTSAEGSRHLSEPVGLCPVALAGIWEMNSGSRRDTANPSRRGLDLSRTPGDTSDTFQALRCRAT